MGNYYKIKDRLAEAMRLRGLNMSELAAKSGLSKSSLSRYVSGQVIPRQNAITQLAQALGVSPLWLLGYDVSISGKAPNEAQIDFEALTETNKARLMSYYEALIESQKG